MSDGFEDRPNAADFPSDYGFVPEDGWERAPGNGWEFEPKPQVLGPKAKRGLLSNTTSKLKRLYIRLF